MKQVFEVKELSADISVPAGLWDLAQNVPMADFARSIAVRAGRPVIDETGLSGHYDFNIRYEGLPRLSTVSQRCT